LAARESDIRDKNNKLGNIAPYGWSTLAGGFEMHTNEETEQHNQRNISKIDAVCQ
jgi:hypothetical protein